MITPGCVMQGTVSASTIALRAALIKQAQGKASALAALTQLPGCNRTVNMQFEFVVCALSIEQPSLIRCHTMKLAIVLRILFGILQFVILIDSGFEHT